MDKSPTRIPDILADVTYNDNEDEEEEKDVEEENSIIDEPPVCPMLLTELSNAVELLKSYSLFSENAEMLGFTATFIKREMSSQATSKTQQLITLIFRINDFSYIVVMLL